MGMLRYMRVLAVAALGLVASACSLADSRLLDETAEVGCHDTGGSSLGAYYLPKSYFEVSVYRWRDPNTHVDYHKLQVEGLKTKADPSRLYCLTYLASPTARDTVRAWKTDDGVLHKISARAEDQTAEIIKKILQTVFTLVIGFGDGGRGDYGRGDLEAVQVVPWVEIFRAEYDPTDLPETAFVNNRLKDFGFCLISEGDPESRPLEPGRYCEAPMARVAPERGWSTQHRPASAKDEVVETAAVPARRDRTRVQHGIFYRPRLPYDIYLFARLDRKQPGNWSFRRKATIEIENHAPVISVGVERTVFATRTTVLDFDHGVLTDVKLYKTSELQQVTEIVLYVADQVAKLPTNIIKFRIDQFQNETTLKRAEAALMQAQYDRLKGVTKGADTYKGVTRTGLQAKGLSP